MKKLIYIIIGLFLFSSPVFCQDSIYDDHRRQQIEQEQIRERQEFEQETRDAQKKQEKQIQKLIESIERTEHQRKTDGWDTWLRKVYERK